jgi:hypothetical protein
MKANSSISRIQGRSGRAPGRRPPALVVRELAGQEVELAAVGLADRVAVDHLLGIPVHVHAAVDADERVRLAGEGHEVVGDGDHRERELALQPAQQRVERVLGGEVEAAGGLVEHEQARAGAQGLRQQHPALLAAGELAHRARGQRLDADQREAAAHGLARRGAGAPPGPLARQAQAHGVRGAGGEAARDLLSLRHVAHPRRVLAGAERAPEDLDAPGADRDEAQDGAQQRGLAGAVRPHHAEEVPRREREAHVLEHEPPGALDAHALAEDRALARGRGHGAPAPSARAKARASKRSSSA